MRAHVDILESSQRVMGNITGLSRLWTSTIPDEMFSSEMHSGEATEYSVEQQDGQSESSSGSSEYRSAQGDSFTDDDKEVSDSPTKNQSLPVMSTRCTLKVMENKSQANISQQVLQAHYNDLLVDISHPYSLVSDLLQKKIFDQSIGCTMLADHLTRREKMGMLVDAIIAKVSANPTNFEVIINVLENRPPHHSVARMLLQSYGELLAGNDLSELTYTYSSATLEYAEGLKVKYTASSGTATVHNLKLMKTGINTTQRRHIVFQSSAFNTLEKSLIEMQSVSCADVFDINTECVLIEGEQCIGKTHLVMELCEGWDKIPSLKKYQLVLLLNFKGKSTVEDLEGLFPDCDPHLQQSIVQDLCNGKGKNILVIMDGFEKLSETIMKNHNSFVIQLLTGKVLPKSTKIVTATPPVAQQIIGSYDLSSIRHYRLLGFQPEHITIYNKESATTDDQGLHSQQHLMHLPINASIVAKLQNKSTFSTQDPPHTHTEYYSLHCLELISEYLSDPSLLQDPQDFFSHLNPAIQKNFVEISRLALMDMIQRTTPSDEIEISKDFSGLGLLFISCDGMKTEISFPNSMLQAFLAAYYISQLEDHERDQIFFSHSLSDMKVVWRFVAGLTDITEATLQILKSSIHDTKHLPFIVSLLYEHQDGRTVRRVLEDGVMITYAPEQSTNLAFQCFALGYCIAASNCIWNLNFSASNLEKADVEALIRGLSSISSGTYTINTLQINKNHLTYETILLLSELPLHELRSLNLNSCFLSQDALDYVSENLISAMPRLQAIDIGNNKLITINKLLCSLKDLKEFQTLSIDNITLDLPDMVPLSTLMSTFVTEVSIGGDMVPETTSLLIDTVLAQSSVETLHISDLDLTESSDTFTLLETSTNLNRLVLFECKLDLIHLTTMLCMNTTLKQLEIFYSLSDAKYDIGPQSIVALTDMLEVNRSLCELSLYSYRTLERKKVLNLVETLKYNRSLELLQLPYHYSQHISASELDVVDPRVYWKAWPCINL